MFGKNPGPARDAWLFAFLGPQSGLWGQSAGNLDENLWRSMFDSFPLIQLWGLTCVRNKMVWKPFVKAHSLLLQLCSWARKGFLRLGRFSVKPWIWPFYLESSPQMLALLTCATGSIYLFPMLLWYLYQCTNGFRTIFLKKIASRQSPNKSRVSCYSFSWMKTSPFLPRCNNWVL